LTEEFGLVMCRSKHLGAIPTYRLNKMKLNVCQCLVLIRSA
jgi:hypothetical protein